MIGIKLVKVNIVLLNKGVYVPYEVLKSNLKNNFQSIKGIGYKNRESVGCFTPIINAPQGVVPQERKNIEDMANR